MRVEWSTHALRRLKKVRDAQRRLAIVDAVAALQRWPDVKNVKALASRADYRLRVGRYRIIFEVDAPARVLRITDLGIRNERTY